MSVLLLEAAIALACLAVFMAPALIGWWGIRFVHAMQEEKR